MTQRLAGGLLAATAAAGPRAELAVYVHGTRAGTMTVSRAGYAQMDRDQGRPPHARAATQIRVSTRSGTLAASGTFRVTRN